MLCQSISTNKRWNRMVLLWLSSVTCVVVVGVIVCIITDADGSYVSIVIVHVCV